MSNRVEIDALACTGHGDCAVIAPDVFAVGETAIVIGEDHDGLALKAAEACPALAITVIDEEGGILYP